QRRGCGGRALLADDPLVVQVLPDEPFRPPQVHLTHPRSRELGNLFEHPRFGDVDGGGRGGGDEEGGVVTGSFDVEGEQDPLLLTVPTDDGGFVTHLDVGVLGQEERAAGTGLRGGAQYQGGRRHDRRG